MRRRNGGGAILAAVCISCLISGCAVTVPPELMVPTSAPSSALRTDKALAVAPVTGGAEPNTIAVELMDQVKIGNAEFQAALVKALETSGFFRRVISTGTSDYQLQAHIVSQQPQRAGFRTVTSSLVVNYRLRESGSDHDVWSETIISQDTAEATSFRQGVPGAMRTSLAAAARQNLVEMLEKLSHNLQ